MKLFKRIVLVITLLIFIITGLIYANILYWANNAEPQKSDVIIVLGCQTWGKGPSELLSYRLDKALELYNKSYASNIIVSGGKGKDELAPESDVMRDWLLNHGVAAKNVTEEDKSTNTYENIKFSKDIMDKCGFKSAVIVSNDFHISRSLRIAREFDIKASGAPAPTTPHLKLYYQAREILAVIKGFVLNR